MTRGALLASLVVACATPETSSDSAVAPEVARVEVPDVAGPEWMSEVSARIRDASHSFSHDGDDWSGEVPERSMRGRFGADRARLELEDDSIGIRVAAVGRPGAFVAAEAGTPALGACNGRLIEPDGGCVRRLEIPSDGVIEWWASRGDGFEQGFVVEAPPGGDGDLAIEIEVADANVVLGDADLRLEGDVGGVVVVSGLAAWDADGNALATRFVGTEGGFGIRVEDDGAAYPIEIDPLYETPAWSAEWFGGSAGFGGAVAGAGDVDGDGYDDVIVGGVLPASLHDFAGGPDLSS